ncbi:hypothetical protein CK203_092530 [Vitis vinifera]|uniref:Uncharacterized protein n=1 Tax=Vitis vinifera TaxID=29760 RepID=A0A438DHP1_VITVI|nr:hypothetical protein CK203_092530 [Vitis vinifera]
MHVVSWGVVCKDKKYGGLGIRRLKILNWALPSKCLWRFANKHNIYGEPLEEDEMVLESGNLFMLENGMRTKSCWDRWVGEGPLKVPFLLPFSLASAKDAIVADLWAGGRNGAIGFCGLEGTSKIGKWME